MGLSLPATLSQKTWHGVALEVRSSAFAGETLFTQDALKEQVVLPRTGNLEIFFGNADGLESRFAQDLLGTKIVQQCAGLEAVKAEILDAVIDDVFQGCGGEALSDVFFVDPVPDVGALEWPANDAREIDSTDDRVAIDDDEWNAGSCVQLFNLVHEDRGLFD